RPLYSQFAHLSRRLLLARIADPRPRGDRQDRVGGCPAVSPSSRIRAPGPTLRPLPPNRMIPTSLPLESASTRLTGSKRLQMSIQGLTANPRRPVSQAWPPADVDRRMRLAPCGDCTLHIAHCSFSVGQLLGLNAETE